MDKERELIREASGMLLQGKMHGSLTFCMCVVNRDWEAVKQLAPSQRDQMHGVSMLTDNDWKYLGEEAAKDSFTL